MFTVEVITLIAPGKFAVTDFARGTAREAYRRGRRLARLSLLHSPDALAGGHRVLTFLTINRDGRFFKADMVRNNRGNQNV